MENVRLETCYLEQVRTDRLYPGKRDCIEDANKKKGFFLPFFASCDPCPLTWSSDTVIAAERTAAHTTADHRDWTWNGNEQMALILGLLGRWRESAWTICEMVA